MTVAAIILAAGASRRLGQPKQLVGIAGEALLARTLRIAKEAEAAPILAVLGANFAPICVSISFNEAIPVLNDKWEMGISSSIHAGLAELDARAPEASGAMILPCDQPRLNTAHVRSMIKAFTRHKGTSIISSYYAETVGIPAIFPRSMFAHLHTLQGDKGARSLLLNPPCTLVSIPFEGGEIDIDLPSDLAHLG